MLGECQQWCSFEAQAVKTVASSRALFARKACSCSRLIHPMSVFRRIIRVARLSPAQCKSPVYTATDGRKCSGSVNSGARSRLRQ
ncbi:hypothetical protein GE061_010256 [Apolygus lucorum]|uniref:Uncharacterized protein n=1 Tax=Apolygus lucorum TaxID=248454 RepID=A0A8S9Y2I0_APOLU|nr:hypothetical protein GE061_010256 [Apolygus lucorum]